MDWETDNSTLCTGNGRFCTPAVGHVPNEWREFRESASQSDMLSGAEFRIGEAEEILFSVAVAVEQRDRHTAEHCERLAWIGVALGIAMGLARTSLAALYRGGYLHDVGKIGIPDSILFKPGELTAEEWVVMRSHSARGEEICRPMKSLAPVLPIIRHHHERWDGSGYPDGLRGEQIPLLARVLQVADIYDSLISPRPYKPAFSDAQALQVIEQETERGWRDPEIVQLFLRLHKDVISPGAGLLASTPGSLTNLRQMVTLGLNAD